MTTIYLKNFEVEHCLMALSKTQRNPKNAEGVNALTMHKLNKLVKDVNKEYEDFKELKTKLLDEHVKGGSEDPKLKGDNFDFKSKKAKEAFLEAMDEYVALNVRSLLAESDLANFSTDAYSIQWLEKMLVGEALTEDPNKEEEEPKKKAKKAEK